jgi:protoporphyrinogen oxidase
MDEKIIILGAGMTGLAAGISSGLPVFEATDICGGICSSYYLRAGETKRRSNPPANDSAYRFEIGGGHWIFGGDPTLNQFMRKFVSLKRYKRRSSVYFHGNKSFVPYPLQNHLKYLDRDLAVQAISEISRPSGSSHTMEDWLESSFGKTLCDLFFYPFHELYTAGLYNRIAPQDAYKSPVDLPTVIKGALSKTTPVGYNTTFVYPKKGLNELAQNMADKCNIQYHKKVVKINTARKEITFADGDKAQYDQLISTLPLNLVLSLSGIAKKNIDSDPYSSVLVLNIGARRGPKCPKDHWLYTPDSFSKFHRVGFYSNVDRSFLPKAARKKNEKVSIYVERAFPANKKPSKKTIDKYAQNVIAELQDWKFIKAVDVVDPTWIDVAYTWSWPDSSWKNWAVDTLQQQGIYQVGRYGAWKFQGIADSIRDGLFIGSALKP